MEEGSCSAFSVGAALEMIFEFDGSGKISYANAEAEKSWNTGMVCADIISQTFSQMSLNQRAVLLRHSIRLMKRRDSLWHTGETLPVFRWKQKS